MIARVLAAALAVAVLFAGLQTYRLATEQRDHVATMAAHAEHIAGMERAAREAEASARAEEQRRTAEVQKVANEANEALERARADADAAADAGVRLRERVAQLTAACGRGSSHPGPATAGQAADTTADLLADVQRRLDEAANGIARFADQAHAAGDACQRVHGALTP